jgi:16S rRNA (guanine527-N7)-methyltransferase
MTRMRKPGATQGPGAATIRELLAEAGIESTEEAAARLAAHAGEMLRWNRAVRLTAIVDPIEVAVKHIVDSLLLLRFAPFPGRLMDFGSGAGYPGVPLAVYLPGTSLVLVDSSAKKCAFLSRVRAMLGLENVKVCHGTVSAHEMLPIRRFDDIVTRATASPEKVLPLLAPYLAEGGRVLLMAGPAAEGRSAIPGTVTRRERFRLPRGMGEREILEVVPTGNG